MARSVKKHPVLHYAPKSGRYGKTQANRRVRRHQGAMSDGKFYRKLYCSWNIHDCCSRTTLNEHLERWGDWMSFCEDRGYDWKGGYYGDTLQGAINVWKRSYIRK